MQSDIAAGYFGHLKQIAFLSLEKFGDTLRTAGHLVRTVGQAVGKNLFIEFFKILRLRNRNHIVPPSKAYQPFHSAFLIAAVRVAEPGRKTVIRPEFTEAFLLNTLSSLENLTYRCR